MSTTAQIIAAIEASQATGTAAEVLDAITAKVISKTRNARLTFGDVLELIDGQAHPILAKLDAFSRVETTDPQALVARSLVSQTLRNLSGVGINFSTDVTRAEIDSLVTAGIISSDDGATLKGIGRWTISHLENAGGSSASESDVALAIGAMLRSSIRNQIVQRYNATIDAFDSGQYADWDEARAALGAE